MTAETNVHIPALIGWARIWDEQSEVFASIATQAGGTMPSGEGARLGEEAPLVAAGLGVLPGSQAAGLIVGDYPLFQGCLDAYEQVCPQLARVAAQASQQMAGVVEGLIIAAKTYSDNEADLTQASRDALK